MKEKHHSQLGLEKQPRHRLYFSVIVLVTMAANTAIAALAPDTVARQKTKAPEVLKVEITTVAKGEAKGEDQKIVYTAKITAVVRSKSGYAVGDTIKIHSYIRNPHHKGLPMPGPQKPSLHEPGWQGTVFMAPLKQKNELKIAVYGHSFVGS